LEKKIGLLDAVSAGTEVVGTPKQPRCLCQLASGPVKRIDKGRPLRRLVNDPNNTVRLGLGKINIPVVMRKIYDHVDRCHLTLSLLRLSAVDGFVTASISLPD
jgi:hypothetical protein